MDVVKRIHNVWPTVVVVLALAVLLTSERFAALESTQRIAYAGICAALWLVAALARAVSLWQSPARQRFVKGWLLFSTVGIGLALLVYGLSQSIELSDKPKSIASAAWPVITLVFLIILTAIEVSVWPGAYNPNYEMGRMRHAVNRALGFGLLLSSLFFANYVIVNTEEEIDLSRGAYAPKPEVVEVAAEITEPVSVLLFYPRSNEVASKLLRYFTALRKRLPNYSVKVADYAVAIEEAKRAEVSDNGYIVLLRGAATEKIRVPIKARNARGALRKLDESVAGAIIRLGTEDQVAYYTLGHGERGLKRKAKGDLRVPMTALARLLENSRFQLKPLGVAQGLTESVPEDADLVLILDPQRDFLAAEAETLARAYRSRGLRILLLADEPHGLEPLLQEMKLRFGNTPLASTRTFVPLTRTQRDHSFVYSTQFSSHPAVSVGSQNAQMAAVFESPRPLITEPSSVRLTQVIVSALPGTFEDVDGNYLRGPGEQDTKGGLVTASTKTSTGASALESRALVIGDADIFADTLIRLEPNFFLFKDMVGWLQRTKSPIMPKVSDDDIKIVHKSEDDGWLFYGTTLAVPLLLLILGTVATRRR